MLDAANVEAFAKAHDYPSPTDPQFWSKVAVLIDEGIEEHQFALKDWWIVRRVPFWYSGWAQIELNFLIALQDYYRKASPQKQLRLAKGLTEPYLGHTSETYEVSTLPFGVDNFLTGSWPLKCGHHIMKWEQRSGRDITEYDHIIEIGAGLGELPRYCYDIGYTGTYTVLDLAPTCKIQQAYLKGLYPVRWVNEVRQIEKKENTLVIATWSLSEIDYGTRADICRNLAGLDWFVIFQSNVFQLNNVAWFPKFFGPLTETKVAFENMAFHMFQGGSFYAYGSPVAARVIG